jgi:hypothetical protein
VLLALFVGSISQVQLVRLLIIRRIQ